MSLRALIREMMMSEDSPRAILTVGIPGSGKSTQIEKLFPDVRVISPDSHLYSNGVYVWTPERASNAWKSSYQEVQRAMESGESFVFDATFVSRKSRKQLLKILRGSDYEKIALWVDTPVEVAMSRNAARPEDRQVPDETMESMASRFQPPTEDEGFDQVMQVPGG